MDDTLHGHGGGFFAAMHDTENNRDEEQCGDCRDQQPAHDRDRQKADIGKAVNLLNSLKTKILG